MATGKKLLRSSDRWIAGVCGGIADYFDWDPAMVRIIYLLLSYIVLWIIMPKS